MARHRGGDKTLYSAPILLPYSPSFSWWKKTEMGGRKSSFRRKKRLLYHRAPPVVARVEELPIIHRK